MHEVDVSWKKRFGTQFEQFEIKKCLTGITLTVLWYNMQAHMLNVEDEDVADD